MKVKITDQNKIIREAYKASYDIETIYSIIDATSLCHLGFVDNKLPVVVPILHWRVGSNIYIHAASNGRLARCCQDMNVVLSIALLDGYTLARSAFNHSMNYRSVVIHGIAKQIEDPEKKQSLLKDFMEGLFPGRWEELRPVKSNELKATAIFEIPLNSASAKMRSGGPGDEKDDPEWRVWTGELPVTTQFMEPVPEIGSSYELPIPEYLKHKLP